jgi:hypothetical protein
MLRKKEICDDLGIHESTLWTWIRKKHYPPLIVLNDGVGNRPILGLPLSEHLAFKAGLPRGMGKPLKRSVYEARKRKKPTITITPPPEDEE